MLTDIAASPASDMRITLSYEHCAPDHLEDSC